MKLRALAPFLLQGTLWWVVAKPVFLLFTRFTVRGYEHVANRQAPIIFAPNHSHPLDSVLLPLALPLWSKYSPLFYVVKESSRYSAWRKVLFTIFNLRLIGAIPFEHNKKDYALSLNRHVQLLKNGASLCIFPEGKFTETGKMGDVHGGVSYLSSTSNIDVVPTLIQGTFHLTLFDFLTRRRTVTIEFFPPVPAGQVQLILNEGRSYKEAAAIIMQNVTKVC